MLKPKPTKEEELLWTNYRQTMIDAGLEPVFDLERYVKNLREVRAQNKKSKEKIVGSNKV